MYLEKLRTDFSEILHEDLTPSMSGHCVLNGSKTIYVVDGVRIQVALAG